MCPPHITAEFANNHDFAIVACLRRLLEVDELPAPALAIAHLHGGLGLTCAATLANPAFWSSWADSLPVLQTQLPQYAAQILQHLQHPAPAIPSIQAAAGAAQALQEHGWTPPNWVELAQGNRPNPADTDPKENTPRMATASNHPGPHSHVQWAPSRDPSSQPSLASLPSWPLCKPSLHHHTLHHRVRISIPPLQDSPSPSSSFAPPTLRTFLSVPSPS